MACDNIFVIGHSEVKIAKADFVIYARGGFFKEAKTHIC